MGEQGSKPKVRPLKHVPRGASNPTLCSVEDSSNAHSYHLVQAMRFAVEEINNSSGLLPGVTLGYVIYDSCTFSANMYAALSLLSRGRGGCAGCPQVVEVAANYTRYLPQAVAAVGPDSSDDAVLTASLLGIFRIPVVSYEASSPVLSQKDLYPSFLRTIPPDYMQVRALISVLEAFNWTWVAAVASNNNYGAQGLQQIQERSSRAGICLAYQGVLPAESDADELGTVVDNLAGSGTTVVIVYANQKSLGPFFREVVRRNVSGKVWLGTEDWSLSTDIAATRGIRGIGTVIGVSLREPPALLGMEAFEAGLAGCKEAAGSNGSACRSRGEACSQRCVRFCRPDDWQPPSVGGADMSPRDARAVFSVYSAVYTVAHGLHRLLGCQTGGCRNVTVYPWQLLKATKQVNFRLFHRQIRFDSKGDILDGYELVLWNWAAGQTWNYSVIGSFSHPGGLSIDPEKLRWHTEDNQVTRRT